MPPAPRLRVLRAFAPFVIFVIFVLIDDQCRTAIERQGRLL
jgi:hypothetical protein